MGNVLKILAALADIYTKFSKLQRTWAETSKARAEAAKQIQAHEKELAKNATEIIKRSVTDSDIDRKLREDKF